MKKLIITVTVLTLILVNTSVFGQENKILPYIGLGDFQLKISDVKVIDKIKTKDGIVTAGNRHSNLVEVKLTGNAPSAGMAILNQNNFSVVFNYRGQYRVVAAKAIGVKPEVAPGKIVDVIISDPEANMNCENSKAGGKEEIYLYVDIPKEIKEFQVQIPQLVENRGEIP